MKKKIWIGTVVGVLLVATFSFLLTGQLKGQAQSQRELFQMDGNVLMKYLGDAEVVYVPDSVRTIARGAFEDNDSIKKVVLPSRLERIEYNAFTECDNLMEIDIPDNVTYIGSAAFANCKALCDVSIGKSVEELGSGVFAGCSSLKDITVSTKSTTLTCLDGVLLSADRSYLYQMLPGREQPYYIMNENVEEIGQYAFWGCDKLEHVILSDKLKKISPYAFSNAANLKSVSMSFAVTSIEQKAFEDCVSLEQIYLPDSVRNIHTTAFDGCVNLQFYTAAGTYGSLYGEENGIAVSDTPIYHLNYAEELKEDYYAALKEAEEEDAWIIRPITIGDDVLGHTTVVSNQAVVFMGSDEGEVISGVNADHNDALNEMAETGNVPDSAFYGEKTLSDVNIPEGVTEIGKFAYARSSVEAVSIPQGVTSIGYAAFYHCDDLTEVNIPDSVTSIGNNAFKHTPWLDDWFENGNSDYLIVGDGVLIAYKCPDDEFVLPENVNFVACDVPK